MGATSVVRHDCTSSQPTQIPARFRLGFLVALSLTDPRLAPIRGSGFRRICAKVDYRASAHLTLRTVRHRQQPNSFEPQSEPSRFLVSLIYSLILFIHTATGFLVARTVAPIATSPLKAALATPANHKACGTPTRQRLARHLPNSAGPLLPAKEPRQSEDKVCLPGSVEKSKTVCISCAYAVRLSSALHPPIYLTSGINVWYTQSSFTIRPRAACNTTRLPARFVPSPPTCLPGPQGSGVKAKFFFSFCCRLASTIPIEICILGWR